MYPERTDKEREDLITKEHGIVFIMQIGGALKSGKPHDKDILRASAEYASRFTAEVIDYSLLYGDAEPRRDGVLLEGCLGKLYSEIGAK